MAVLAQKAAGPSTAPGSASSRAEVAEALRAECQAARLQAEQGLATLQDTPQQLKSTRRQEVAALQDGLLMGATALQASRCQLQASRRQLQQQVALQSRRHQEARYAELCAQHRLAVAEGAMDGRQARAGEQPPRFGAAARKVWQVLPEGIPGHPYIAHRAKVLTQGPSNRSRPAWQIDSLPKSRFPPGPAAAERPHPAGSVAPGCPASAGFTGTTPCHSQAASPAGHHLRAALSRQ